MGTTMRLERITERAYVVRDEAGQEVARIDDGGNTADTRWALTVGNPGIASAHMAAYLYAPTAREAFELYAHGVDVKFGDRMMRVLDLAEAVKREYGRSAQLQHSHSQGTVDAFDVVEPDERQRGAFHVLGRVYRYQ